MARGDSASRFAVRASVEGRDGQCADPRATMSRSLWLVAYDVSCRRRWRLLYGLLKRRGAHHQLSVFLVLLDAAGRRRLAAEIGEIIDPRVDSALLARLAGSGEDDFVEIGREGEWPGARILIL